LVVKTDGGRGRPEAHGAAGGRYGRRAVTMLGGEDGLRLGETEATVLPLSSSISPRAPAVATLTFSHVTVPPDLLSHLAPTTSTLPAGRPA